MNHLHGNFITRLARDLMGFLQSRPGMDLESIDHFATLPTFDLGKVRKDQPIYNRSGCRIFISSLTGTAQVRKRSAGQKYDLFKGSMSFPFKKLYLSNAAQAGKSLTLMIGLQSFVDLDPQPELVLPATDTPTPYNVEMSDADKEYSQVLPDNLKQITFFVRDLTNFRYAWVTGKVEGPTAPYTEVLANGVVFLDKLKWPSKTLYFACANAGKIMQIEVLT